MSLPVTIVCRDCKAALPLTGVDVKVTSHSKGLATARIRATCTTCKLTWTVNTANVTIIRRAIAALLGAFP